MPPVSDVHLMIGICSSVPVALPSVRFGCSTIAAATTAASPPRLHVSRVGGAVPRGSFVADVTVAAGGGSDGASLWELPAGVRQRREVEGRVKHGGELPREQHVERRSVVRVNPAVARPVVTLWTAEW